METVHLPMQYHDALKEVFRRIPRRIELSDATAVVAVIEHIRYYKIYRLTVLNGTDALRYGLPYDASILWLRTLDQVGVTTQQLMQNKKLPIVLDESAPSPLLYPMGANNWRRWIWVSNRYPFVFSPISLAYNLLT